MDIIAAIETPKRFDDTGLKNIPKTDKILQDLVR
jgi:hypothetical protein